MDQSVLTHMLFIIYTNNNFDQDTYRESLKFGYEDPFRMGRNSGDSIETNMCNISQHNIL